MTINELCEKAHANAYYKGFWEDYTIFLYSKDMEENLRNAAINNAIATRLMLIVSEVSEALESLRNDDDANFAEEIADVAIRLGDLCGGLDIDLEGEIKKKMAKNRYRPHKHGKAF